MTIQTGQRIPSVTIKQATSEGPKEVDPAALFAGKRVILFSLPGAFTPTCTNQHLAGYLAKADEIRSKGVDLIACMAVNDHHVMKAWATAQNVGDKIVMLADGNALFTRALGIEQDMSGVGMGVRARRCVFELKDAVVQSMSLDDPGKFEVSGAEACTARL
jgi:peroxiredoxin